MWRLTIEDDEGNQTSLPLAHADYTLGRDADSAIRLTDRNVSRHHAKLSSKSGEWTILDLKSYNGTFVNGIRVAETQTLGSGDIVQLGDYRLELVDEELDGKSLSETTADITQPVPLHQRPNRLVVVLGPAPGAEYPLDKERLTIGRAEDCSISINHASVSRLHAELVAIGGGRYEAIDKGSANGIRINGVDLRAGIVEPGDAIELGDVRLRYVAAGKIFRADADTSTSSPMRAVVGFEASAPPKRPTAGPSVSRNVAVALGSAAIILAILGAVYVLSKRDGGQSTSPAATAAASDPAQQVLRAAQDLYDKGDLERAHTTLAQIPENSSLRDSDAYRDIETHWARSALRKAEGAPTEDRKRLLQLVASCTGADSEVRSVAAKALQAEFDLAASRPPVVPNDAPRTSGAQPTPVTSSTTATGADGASATKSSGEPTPTPKPTVDPPPDEPTIRRRIESRVFSGKAPIDEIRMLIAICRHMGDQDCRDRATAILKEKTEGKPKDGSPPVPTGL